MKARCADCGVEFLKNRQGPCPECGSIKRALTVADNVGIGITERYWLKGRGNKIRKKRLGFEMVQGHSLFKKTGKWNLVFRVIDRINNWYRERITDQETGAVILERNESLTSHTGHGSAKGKTPSPIHKTPAHK